jgi:predicted phosphodiesterase
MRYGWWVVAIIALACGAPEPEGDGPPPGRSSRGGDDGKPPGSSGTLGGNGTDAGTASGATEPNFKVAFIGDTASGSDFLRVLRLVKAEGAKLVLVQGDITYDGKRPADWFPVIDNEINQRVTGSPATVTIPYFIAKGNHDEEWDTIGTALSDRLRAWSIPVENGEPRSRNYSIVYKGLKVVMASDSETTPSRTDYVRSRLQGDKQIWKICSWHRNQRRSNVGPKDDEMGWAIYEACRDGGAFVAQGHSHTYSRSKTLSVTTNQTVDPACSDPLALCVGPGKHFFLDSSLGGVDTRSVNSTIARLPHWASTFSGDFGALFIEFHVDGDPRKAKGYFKTIGGSIIDPAPSSGKTFFTITSSN